MSSMKKSKKNRKKKKFLLVDKVFSAPDSPTKAFSYTGAYRSSVFICFIYINIER